MSRSQRTEVRRRFEAIVRAAVAELPAWVKPHLEHLTIVIEEEPSRQLLEDEGLDPDADTLFGIYDGIPIGEKSRFGEEGFHPHPDTIRIFREPLEAAFPDERELAWEIRVTVIHEVGHHLGLDEDDLARLGFD